MIQQQGGVGGHSPPSLVQTGKISRDNHGNAVGALLYIARFIINASLWYDLLTLKPIVRYPKSREDQPLHSALLFN